MTTTTTAPTAADLEQQLRRQGYEPGAPPALTPTARTVDEGTARRMRCPICRKRMGRFIPYQRSNVYRAVAVCRHCGAAEEL